MAVTKKGLIRWLESNGFERQSGRASGNLYYKHASSGVKVTVPGHGRTELSKKHLGMMIRQLEAAGFEKGQLRRELRA